MYWLTNSPPLVFWHSSLKVLQGNAHEKVEIKMAEQTILRHLFLFHIAHIFTILLIVFIITIMGKKKILLLLVESSNVFR